jgi:hypothetical protein
MSLVLLVTLCCACPNGEVCECSPTTGASVERPAESAAIVASSPTLDAGASAMKRVGGRRASRVVARLERRIARHKRA